MNKTRLSQPIGLMLEWCRAQGITDEELIHCLRTRNFARLQAAGDGTINFEKTLDIANEIGNDWESAIRFGYEYNYITISGLTRLLARKFGRQQQADYRVEGLSIHGLTLSDTEAGSLQGMIARQWLVKPEDSSGNEQNNRVYTVELKYLPLA